MTAQVPSNLTSLYTELNKYGQSRDFDRALRIANKILQEDSEEFKACHCKVVCQIQLGRFEDALNTIRKCKKPKDLLFEKAYCEYRLNRTKEALTALRSIPEPALKEKELLAQVLYRLEEHEECFQVYKDLVKNTADDFEDERETNLSAVLAMYKLWGDGQMEETGLRQDTYELSYNYACFLLGKGLYKDAEVKLREAEELCRKTLEEDPDTTEEEIDSELGVIRVQLAYSLQMQHRNDEAMKLVNLVMKTRPADAGLAAVASNNIVALNKEQNMFDSKKKIKIAMGDGLQHKLVSEQRKAIAMNHCLLCMYTNQADQCKKAAKGLLEKFPDSDTPALIQTAQLCREKDFNGALAFLQNQVDKNDCKLETKLTLAQLYLAHGNTYKACDVLQNLGDLSYRPGVVSALVTLYQSQEDKEAALGVLRYAVSWYKDNDPKSEAFIPLMKYAAYFYLKIGEPKEATVMLEELRRLMPKDNKILAQLISAYSKFDAKKAQQISQELPPVSDLAADVNVDGLEAAFNTLTMRYVKKSTKPESSPKVGAGEEIVSKKKKRKHKKGKLPKNCDPKAEIDPERWLPKRERSYYRGKRKDKRKDIGKGTQGSASASDMDASKTASPSGSEIGSPRPGSSAQTSSGPRQQKPSVNKSKKKKKGGKW